MKKTNNNSVKDFNDEIYYLLEGDSPDQFKFIQQKLLLSYVKDKEVSRTSIQEAIEHCDRVNEFVEKLHSVYLSFTGEAENLSQLIYRVDNSENGEQAKEHYKFFLTSLKSSHIQWDVLPYSVIDNLMMMICRAVERFPEMGIPELPGDEGRIKELLNARVNLLSNLSE